MAEFTDGEKLEVVEHMIEQWRVARGSAGGDRDVYLILKAIAKDIRGRMPGVPHRARDTLQRAIERATAAKTGLPGAGYQGRTMFALAQVVIGEWATIRQALEKFEGDPK